MSILTNPLSEINDTVLENKGYHRVTWGSPKFDVNSDGTVEFRGALWGPEQIAWEMVIDGTSAYTNITGVITYFPAVFDTPVTGISDIGIKPANNAIVMIAKNNKEVWKVIKPVNDIGDLDVIKVELDEKIKQFEDAGMLDYLSVFMKMIDDRIVDSIGKNTIYYADKPGVGFNTNKQTPKFGDYFTLNPYVK